jgi:hypothetical protein
MQFDVGAFVELKHELLGSLSAPTSATLISFTQTAMSHPAKVDLVFIFAQGTYWPPVVLLLFSRRRWQDFTLLGIAIVGYVANAFIPNWAI